LSALRTGPEDERSSLWLCGPPRPLRPTRLWEPLSYRRTTMNRPAASCNRACARAISLQGSLRRRRELIANRELPDPFAGGCENGVAERRSDGWHAGLAYS